MDKEQIKQLYAEYKKYSDKCYSVGTKKFLDFPEWIDTKFKVAPGEALTAISKPGEYNEEEKVLRALIKKKFSNDSCPTCGGKVQVASSDEGTNYFIPESTEEVCRFCKSPNIVDNEPYTDCRDCGKSFI